MSEAATLRYRALLDERSAALAARGLAERRTGTLRAFLVCAVGRERYGLSLAAAASVLPGRAYTPVPGAPAALLGIVAHAGIIASVIDLGRALGSARDGDEAGHGHLLRLRPESVPHAPPVALAVDRVLGLARIPMDRIEAHAVGDGHDGLGAEAVSGYAPAGSDRGGGVSEGFAVIDLPRLLRPFLP